MLFNFFRVKSLPVVLVLAFLAMISPSVQAASNFQGTYQATFTVKSASGVSQVWTLNFKADNNANIKGTASFGATSISFVGDIEGKGMTTAVSSQKQTGLTNFVFAFGGQSNSAVGQNGTLMWNMVNKQPSGSTLPKSQDGTFTIKKISNS